VIPISHLQRKPGIYKQESSGSKAFAINDRKGNTRIWQLTNSTNNDINFDTPSTQTFEIDSSNIYAYINKLLKQSKQKFNLKDYRGAIDDLNNVLYYDSTREYAYIHRAEIKSILGDKQGAIDDYTNAIRIFESSPYR
jgi:hypothetical protein